MTYKSKYTGAQVDRGVELALNSQERIEAAVSTEKTQRENSDSEINSSINALSERVGATESQISSLNDEIIPNAVAEGIAKVVANAPQDLDTLKEVADYIASDKTNAAEIETAISDLKKADTTHDEAIAELQEHLDSLVVNDLTTGGADKALSAEMGKELCKKLNIIYPAYINSFNKIDPSRLNLGKGIGSNGADTIQTNYFNTDFIDVLGHDKVYTQIYANGFLVAYDDTFQFISIPSANTTIRGYELPEGTRYIRLAGSQKLFGGDSLDLYLEENTKFYEYGVTKDKIYTDTKSEELSANINNVALASSARDTDTLSINKINVATDFTDGFIINNEGAVVASTKGCISCFINVHWLEKVYCPAYAYGGMNAYDENLVWIKALLSNSGGFEGAYLIENGVKYVRISVSNKDDKGKIFLYTNEDDLTNKSLMYNSVYYDYGITHKDLEYRKALDVIPTKVDEHDPLYINTINLFTTDLVEEENAFIQSDGKTILRSAAVAGKSYTKYIKVVGCKYLSMNIIDQGSAFSYDKDKNLLKNLPTQRDARFKNDMCYSVIPEDVEYIRLNMKMSEYHKYFLSVGNDIVYDNTYKFGETFDLHFKYRGKKLVTIGDSITYQRTWQDRLCELTGMIHNPKEIRGDNESIKTEGHGYILLDSDLNDTDTYYETVEGITKTTDAIVDGFGYSHPIWTDAEGNKYRQPCRTAEGGETVMPVTNTSIYSRASDSKYYKGDVVIVFAGANDKAKYLNKYPTNGDLSTVKGITNIKDDSEDFTNFDYEIKTDDTTLSVVGDYTEEDDTVGTKKYNHTFRACFRGLLKKVVDANPNAEIIVIGPFATMIKSGDYVSRIYDYLTVEENKIIEECAREFSCQYINLYPIFGRYKADKYFSSADGTVFIHPTPYGGKKIADYIASMIM